MKTLGRAHAQPELLDADAHDPHELAHSLAQVAAVNNWLGGTHALLSHLTPLLSPERVTRILDVGTGSAELPRRIVDWSRRHRREVSIIATDVHPQIRALARAQSAEYPEIGVEAADARALPYHDDAFDIALITLTLHHFETGEQLEVIRELARVARRSVIVNELQRTRLNYIGARLMAATFWRRNRLTRHDGPLSVLRAFTPAELDALCESARLRGRVHHHFFQRLILVIDSASAAAARTELK